MAVLVHGETLRYGFNYDDYYFMRPALPEQVLATFYGPWDDTGVMVKFYRPLTVAFSAARFQLFGLNAVVHHTASLEVPQLEAGQRYVLPIRRSNPSGTGPIPRRPALAPEDDPSLVWATANCGGALRDRLEGDGWLNGFGRGWPPEAR